MSMHYKNRVALGELGFVADLAEVIRRVGLAFSDGLDDPAIRRDFGAAYQSAELSHQERVEALIAKLFPPGRG